MEPQGKETQSSPKRSNGLGTAGFVTALIALLLFWLPVINWILWTTGFGLSIAGVIKRPRYLAIAGVVISFIALALMLVTIAIPYVAHNVFDFIQRIADMIAGYANA